jgi:CelD/BcsL family acetyltransferase involved in cellulose biosynthesis
VTTPTVESVSSAAAFSALHDEWDQLVQAMPRPSPFLLHGWLDAWWRHYQDEGDLRTYVVRRDGVLVGALPLFLRQRRRLRVLEFIGGEASALADLLLAEGAGEEIAVQLAARAAASGQDFADLFGLAEGSRLVTALGAERLELVERVGAPVLDLSSGWEPVYRAKTSRKRRNLHKRRRRQLAELGRLEVRLARTPDELERALEDAFHLHQLRWEGRPDGSGFVTPVGMRFHRDAIQMLAERDVPRIVTLTLDGRPIAFHYYFVFCGRMYVHRLAFDPAFARLSPGIIATLEAIREAADEGIELVEFLGGEERYKLEFSDRLEPMFQGLGLAASPLGRGAVTARLAIIRLRRRLKRSPALHRLYFDGLAPMRRLRDGLRGTRLD